MKYNKQNERGNNMERMLIGDMSTITMVSIEYPTNKNYYKYIFKDDVSRVLLNFIKKFDCIYDIDFDTGISDDYVRISFNREKTATKEIEMTCNEIIEFLYNEKFISKTDLDFFEKV
jgi:hypothetical protein